MFPPLHHRGEAAGGNRIARRLLIRPGAIGDCILSFPALEYLKAEYTEVWISTPVVPLVQFADRVRSIASTQLDLVLGDEFPADLKTKFQEFDEIVSWYGANRPEFCAAIEAIHPNCTFLQALPGSNWHEHAADFFLLQVGAPKGGIPHIGIELTEERRNVVIHPFSGSVRKNWPLERYRELAGQLRAPVEWTAGPEEPLEGAKRFDNLPELARWMKGAAIYVGNDSGISHLAAAIGLPTVALFSAPNADVWAPLGARVKILKHWPLSELPVKSVLQSVITLLAQQ